MNDVNEFIKKKRFFQKIYLSFVLILFIFSLPVGRFIYKNFVSSSVPIIQEGIKKYAIMTSDTNSEKELKEMIIKLSYGLIKSCNFIGILMGYLVGGLFFITGVYNLLLWWNTKKYLNLIDEINKNKK